MAVTLREIFESRQNGLSNSGVTSTRVFHVDNGDPDFVIANLPNSIGSAHPSLSGTRLKNVTVEPVEAQELTVVTYSYEPPEKGEANSNDEIWDYDMTAQTRNITSVENDTADNKPNQITWDFSNKKGGAAATGTKGVYTGINIEGNVARGVDVFRPSGALQVTKYYSISTVNKAFRQSLYGLQNTLNNAAWPPAPRDDWGARQVLMLGARIRYNITDSTCVITYNFLFGEDLTNQEFMVWAEKPIIGASTEIIQIPTIEPFQIVWAESSERTVPNQLNNPANDQQEIHPDHITVANVYKEADWSGLGLVGVD